MLDRVCFKIVMAQSIPSLAILSPSPSPGHLSGICEVVGPHGRWGICPPGRGGGWGAFVIFF